MENDKNKNKKTREKDERVNKFNDGWLKMKEFEGWLEKTENEDSSFCSICAITLIAHKSSLIKHKLSKRHKKNEAKIAHPNQMVPTDEVKRAELKLCAFVAEHNLSLQVTECLVPLCKNIFPDSDIASKIASKRTKTSKIIKHAIGNNLLQLLYEKLKEPSMFFSIIMDETTDLSSVKQCALTVAFMDGENGVKYKFMDMFEVSSGTADNLYNSLKECILSKGIPLENLVGFSSDTTNVMVGEYNSVFSHLKKDCPDIALIKCACHQIHLAASKACLKLPAHIEDLLRFISSYFSRSFGRQKSYLEFQEFFQVEIHKFLSPAKTRWLSVKECVDRVLEQYDPLQAYFRLTLYEDPSDTLQSMLNTMDDKFTKLYLEFMAYVLGTLCEFNRMFQAEKPLLHKLKPEVEKLLKDMCSNYMDVDYVKKTPVFQIKLSDSRYFLPLDEVYLGMSATETLSDLKKSPDIAEEDIQSFFKSILKFYIELTTVVKRKFDFRDELYNVMSVVDPEVAQSYKKIKSLHCVLKRFPTLQKFVDMQELDNEWKRHALMDHSQEGLDATMSANIYWPKVFKIKNAIGEKAFPNLYIVMKLLLVLPISNASVERVFSNLKNCKTLHRNRMTTNTLVALIATKEGVRDQNGCVGFEPCRRMMSSTLWDKAD